MLALSSKFLVLATLATLATASAIPGAANDLSRADAVKAAPALAKAAPAKPTANLPRAAEADNLAKVAPLQNKVQPVIQSVKQRDADRVVLDKTKPVGSAVKNQILARDAPTALNKAEDLAKAASVPQDVVHQPRAAPNLDSVPSKMIKVSNRRLPVSVPAAVPAPRAVDAQDTALDAATQGAKSTRPGAHKETEVHQVPAVEKVDPAVPKTPLGAYSAAQKDGSKVDNLEFDLFSDEYHGQVQDTSRHNSDGSGSHDYQALGMVHEYEETKAQKATPSKANAGPLAGLLAKILPAPESERDVEVTGPFGDEVVHRHEA
ncbi:hypothetical protein MKEN_00220900 [Mycena kentingensis (nom. inval.)]|nr:hypothetical protein MKEN_00220900 [Mycena kentingensis (nom. inval.)]